MIPENINKNSNTNLVTNQENFSIFANTKSCD